MTWPELRIHVTSPDCRSFPRATSPTKPGSDDRPGGRNCSSHDDLHGTPLSEERRSASGDDTDSPLGRAKAQVVGPERGFPAQLGSVSCQDQRPKTHSWPPSKLARLRTRRDDLEHRAADPPSPASRPTRFSARSPRLLRSTSGVHAGCDAKRARLYGPPSCSRLPHRTAPGSPLSPTAPGAFRLRPV